jgi:hypothetical protein
MIAREWLRARLSRGPVSERQLRYERPCSWGALAQAREAAGIEVFLDPVLGARMWRIAEDGRG